MGGREIQKRKMGARRGEDEGRMGRTGRGAENERSEIDVETEMGKKKMEVQGGRGDGADPREKSPGQSPTNGPTRTASTPKPRLSLKVSSGYMFVLRQSLMSPRLASNSL